jgi:hypothetical protein
MRSNERVWDVEWNVHVSPEPRTPLIQTLRLVCALCCASRCDDVQLLLVRSAHQAHACRQPQGAQAAQQLRHVIVADRHHVQRAACGQQRRHPRQQPVDDDSPTIAARPRSGQARATHLRAGLANMQPAWREEAPRLRAAFGCMPHTRLLRRRRHIRRVEQQQVNNARQARLKAVQQVGEDHLRARPAASDWALSWPRCHTGCRASACTACCASVCVVAAAACGFTSVAKHAAAPCKRRGVSAPAASCSTRQGVNGHPPRTRLEQQRGGGDDVPGAAADFDNHTRLQGMKQREERCTQGLGQGHGWGGAHVAQQGQVSHEGVHQRKRVLGGALTCVRRTHGGSRSGCRRAAAAGARLARLVDVAMEARQSHVRDAGRRIRLQPRHEHGLAARAGARRATATQQCGTRLRRGRAARGAARRQLPCGLCCWKPHAPPRLCAVPARQRLCATPRGQQSSARRGQASRGSPALAREAPRWREGAGRCLPPPGPHSRAAAAAAAGRGSGLTAGAGGRGARRRPGQLVKAAFRPGRKQAVRAVLAGRGVFVCLPTSRAVWRRGRPRRCCGSCSHGPITRRGGRGAARARASSLGPHPAARRRRQVRRGAPR